MTGLLLHVALFPPGTTHDCAIGQAGPSILASPVITNGRKSADRAPPTAPALTKYRRLISGRSFPPARNQNVLHGSPSAPVRHKPCACCSSQLGADERQPARVRRA